jgi:hypothetical protein
LLDSAPFPPAPAQETLAKKQAALKSAQEALATVLAKVKALKDKCVCWHRSHNRSGTETVAYLMRHQPDTAGAIPNTQEFAQ